MLRRTCLFLLPLTGLVVGCKPMPVAGPALEPPAINLPQAARGLDASEASAWIQASSSPTILDVREDWEIRKFGGIPGAVWADFLNDQRFEEAVAKLDSSRPCLVYCALGGRSRQAVARLAAKGFTDLSWLEGGFEAWVQSEKPVRR